MGNANVRTDQRTSTSSFIVIHPPLSPILVFTKARAQPLLRGNYYRHVDCSFGGFSFRWPFPRFATTTRTARASSLFYFFKRISFFFKHTRSAGRVWPSRGHHKEAKGPNDDESLTPFNRTILLSMKFILFKKKTGNRSNRCASRSYPSVCEQSVTPPATNEI